MQLVSIRIQNFKAISDCKIDLTNATLLVGTNNSGKTSILQAIHFSAVLMRQAAEANKSSTLSLSAAEYIPTENYRALAHGHKEWGNQSGSPESKVTYFFEGVDADGQPESAQAEIVIKSARNEGLSLTPSIPAKLADVFRRKTNAFSAYIPGLAGIPTQEQYLTKRHVYRKAASGDSNVVLRNILYLLKKTRPPKFLAQSATSSAMAGNSTAMQVQMSGITELHNVVRKIFPDFYVDVSFTEDTDYYISASIRAPSSSWGQKPLEFAGTGFLQVAQIFSYLILFRPKILLIDEPEAHLHPTLQTRLIRALEAKCKELGCVALITTHSPFVARGLSTGSATVWVGNGKIKAATEGDAIKDALGWGALDKKVILFTEDGSDKLIRRILAQSSAGELTSVVTFDGVSKLGSAGLIKQMQTSLGNFHKCIVHRDRDCMTDAELLKWKKEYSDVGIETWITDGSDVEAYFCEPAQIAASLNIGLPQAQVIFDAAFANNDELLKNEFGNKRKEVNKKLYETTGGSPSIEQLWTSSNTLFKVRGKTFLSKVREEAKIAGYDEKRLLNCTEKFIVGKDLIKLIETLAQ